MTDATQNAKDAFLKKLDKEIKFHHRRRAFDSALYQFLVIGSAVAGFAALAFGLIARDHPGFAVWAGSVGALTSVATILSQQLHCVKAVNWHDRKSVELGVIRDKFLFKNNSAPDATQLAELTDEVAELNMRMLDVWERITSTGPTALGRIRKPPKDH
jgi:hypothetical protein